MSPLTVFIRHFSCQLVTLALLAPFPALATEAPPPGVSFGTMMQTFAGLAGILALFVGAAWLMRKINGGKAFMAGDGPLRIVSSLPVGARERIILIEVEDTWLIVGVAPGQVRTLHSLPKGSIPQEALAEGQFGLWLKQFREQRNDAK